MTFTVPAVNGDLPGPADLLASDVFEQAVPGGLTLLDEQWLLDEGIDLVEFAWASHGRADACGRQLVWVELGAAGAGAGEHVAENIGNLSPHFVWIADDDPDFGHLWEYDHTSPPREMDHFGTPSLPRLARTLASLHDLDPAALLVLNSIWDARPYAQIAGRLTSQGDISVDAEPQSIHEWLAQDLQEFAMLRRGAPTVAIAGRHDPGWAQLSPSAAMVLPDSLLRLVHA